MQQPPSTRVRRKSALQASQKGLLAQGQSWCIVSKSLWDLCCGNKAWVLGQRRSGSGRLRPWPAAVDV